jgi:hypothetical protein
MSNAHKRGKCESRKPKAIKNVEQLMVSSSAIATSIPSPDQMKQKR